MITSWDLDPGYGIKMDRQRQSSSNRMIKLSYIFSGKHRQKTGFLGMTLHVCPQRTFPITTSFSYSVTDDDEDEDDVASDGSD